MKNLGIKYNFLVIRSILRCSENQQSPKGDFTEVIKTEESTKFDEHAAPSYDYRILMEEQGQKVLIASYFSAESPPAIGKVLDIREYKEASEYPDQVKVLSVEEPPQYMPPLVPHATIVFVTVEPV